MNDYWYEEGYRLRVFCFIETSTTGIGNHLDPLNRREFIKGWCSVWPYSGPGA